MSLKQSELQYLIQSLQNVDFSKDVQARFRLYQVLNALNDQTISVIEEVNSNQQILKNVQIRFNLEGVQDIVTNSYPVWKEVLLPLDESNNPIGSGIKVQQIWITAQVAPSTTAFVMDILASKDKGANFNSLFPPTNAQKLVLPIGLNVYKYGGQLMSNNVLQNGWLLRFDNLDSDSIVAGVEVTILGTLIL